MRNKLLRFNKTPKVEPTPSIRPDLPKTCERCGRAYAWCPACGGKS